jgi:hypothetical protein
MTTQFNFSEHLHQRREASGGRGGAGPDRRVQRRGHLRRRSRTRVAHFRIRPAGGATTAAPRTLRSLLCPHRRGKITSKSAFVVNKRASLLAGIKYC